MQKPTYAAIKPELKPELEPELNDAELIHLYVVEKNSAAFETLLRRHYNTVHKRLLSLTNNSADADDLAQKLWLKVLENLPTYRDKQKFPHFLNTIATNLVRDEWRRQGTRNQRSLDQMMEDNTQQIEFVSDDEDVVSELGNRAEISHLVRKLIPNLAVKLRAVFLLKHEAEYWDEKQPFQWQHLAELNALDADQASASFINTRDNLITSKLSPDQLDEHDRLLFLVWTQAQRLNKASKQTETYLASLLGIPVNTFKTRYRAALAELSSGLEKWRVAK